MKDKLNNGKSFIALSHTRVLLVITLVIMVAGAIWLNVYKSNTFPHKMKVMLQSRRVLSGTDTGIKVITLDKKSENPVSGIRVYASLKTVNDETLSRAFGISDQEGICQVCLKIPDQIEGEHRLVVTSVGSFIYGENLIEERIDVRSASKLYLSTDKPFYQPGQLVYMRCLCMSSYNMKPAENRKIFFEISDSQSTKIFRKGVSTSKYGIASADLKLADEIRYGTYTITAQEGRNKADVSIQVRKYNLPKFKANISLEKTYTKPGDVLKGEVSANYSFGKPVSKGDVSIELSLLSMDGPRKLMTVSGTLNEEGRYPFSINLPSLSLKGEISTLIVQSMVCGPDKSTSESGLSIPISDNSVLFDVMPEAGHLVPGVENILYCIVARPDGSPLSGAIVTIDKTSIITDHWGIAQYNVIPRDEMAIKAMIRSNEVKETHECSLVSYEKAKEKNTSEMKVFVQRRGNDELKVITMSKERKPLYTRVSIPSLNLSSKNFKWLHILQGIDLENQNYVILKIEDQYGNERKVSKSLDPDSLEDREEVSNIISNYERSYNENYDNKVSEKTYRAPEFIIRTGRAIYLKNEPIRVKVLSSVSQGDFFLDLSKDGQTVESRILTLEKGEAYCTFTPGVYGTLQIFAYKLLDAGLVHGIGKTIYVADNQGLKVNMRTDKDIYRPGDPAQISFCLTDKEGKPTPGVLGVTVVDESVFWLGGGEQQNQEQIFFTLNQDLLSEHISPRIIPAGISLQDAITRCISGKETERDKLNDVTQILLAKASPSVSLEVNAESKYSDPKSILEIITLIVKYFLPLGVVALIFITFLTLVMTGSEENLEFQNQFLSIANPGINLLTINTICGLPFLFIGLAKELSWLPLIWAPFLALLFGKEILHFENKHGNWKSLSYFSRWYALTTFFSSTFFLIICLLWPLADTSSFTNAASISLGSFLIIPFLFLIIRNQKIGNKLLFTYKDLDTWIRFYLELWKALFTIVIGIIVVFSLPLGFIYCFGRHSSDSFITFIFIVLLFAVPIFLIWKLSSVYSNKAKEEKSSFLTLIVLIAIIGFLASLLLPALSSVKEKANGAKHRSNLKQLETILYVEEDRLRQHPSAEVKEQKNTTINNVKPSLIRSFFPETLYVNPSLVTDENGEATIGLNIADSITTWRTTAFAHTLSGQMGKTYRGIRVFQPFFIDMKPPLQLTQMDEYSIPVTIYNYQESAQEFSIFLTPSKGIEMLDFAPAIVLVNSGDAATKFFRIRAKEFGVQTITVKSTCKEEEDTIRHSFDVEPYGQKITDIQNIRYSSEPLNMNIQVPSTAIPGASSLSVRLYDSPASETIGGMEGLLTRPYG